MGGLVIDMAYDPKAKHRGGARKRLIEVVEREVEKHKAGKHSAECMGEIIIALGKYKQAVGK